MVQQRPARAEEARRQESSAAAQERCNHSSEHIRDAIRTKCCRSSAAPVVGDDCLLRIFLFRRCMQRGVYCLRKKASHAPRYTGSPSLAASLSSLAFLPCMMPPRAALSPPAAPSRSIHSLFRPPPAAAAAVLLLVPHTAPDAQGSFFSSAGCCFPVDAASAATSVPPCFIRAPRFCSGPPLSSLMTSLSRTAPSPWEFRRWRALAESVAGGGVRRNGG